MKRILICIILIISVLMLLSCNNVNINPNATKIYEYSYITKKDGIIKNSNKDNKVFISLGKPSEATGQDFGSSFVKDYNGQIYTVNNTENLYRIDSRCEVCKVLAGRPYWFDIDNGNIFFETSPLENHSLYKSSFGTVSTVTIGKDIITKGSNLTYNDSWNNGNFVDFRNNFIAAKSHIFYQAQDDKLHRMTENGNEDTLLTPDDKAINIKYFNGWVYYLNYNFELKRIRPDGSDPETAASGISIKDYEIDEKNNDIVLQTDKDMFYLLTDDLKMTKVDFSINNFIMQKGIEGVSVYLVGFEQSKVFLFFYSDISSDGNRSYIISIDIKDPCNQQIVLTDYIDKVTVYWPKLLDDSIYYYTDKFSRINIDTLNIEEIGDPYQLGMPPNNVPNVTF